MENQTELIKQALLLETQERTLFIDGIEDEAIKLKIKFLLSDDDALTDFVIATSAGDQILNNSSVSAIKPGDRIKRILIKSLIGKGGMGSVYLGYDEKLQRNVAVKVIRSEYLHNVTTQQRFIREAQILSQINHPSICQIYDYIESREGDVLILELVDGCTLNQINVSETAKIKLLIQLCSALQVAHEKGVIHRDLKPDNIMVTAAREVKVLDFGIAQSAGLDASDKAKGESSSLIGTIRYMSPEQAMGQPSTTASDLYSLGIVMQELFSQEPIYEYQNTDELLYQVTHGKVKVSQQLPKDLIHVVHQLTALNAEQRPTAEQTKQMLELMFSKPARKKKRYQSLLVLVLLIVLITVAYWFWFDNKRQNQNNAINNQINQLGYQLKNIYALPKHDTRVELQQIEQSKVNISKVIDEAEFLDEAKKKELQGYLLVQSSDFESAYVLLKQSWQAGNKSINLAKQLLTTTARQQWQLMMSYRDLNAYPQIEQARVKEKITEFSAMQQQILTYLGSEAVKNDAEFTVQKHLLENDFVAALSAIDLVKAKEQGEYADFILAANIQIQHALQLYKAGQFKAAIELMNQAADTLSFAREFGRSFLGIYHNHCYLGGLLLEVGQRVDTDISQTFAQFSQICQEGLQVSPDDIYLLDQLATLHWKFGQWQLLHGFEAMPQFNLALSWNEKALAIDPSMNHYNTRGVINDLIAHRKVELGQDPLPELNQAINAYQQVMQLNPAAISSTTNNMFYAMVIKSQHYLAHGLAMNEITDEAQQLYQAELESPDKVENLGASLNNNYAYLNLIAAFSARNHGADAKVLIDVSMHSYSQVFETYKSENPFAYEGLAENYLLLAEIDFQQNKNPTDLLDLANEAMAKALKLSDQYYWFTLAQANIIKLRAIYLHRQNHDVSELIATAHQLYIQSIALNALYADTWVSQAELFYFELTIAEDVDVQKEKLAAGFTAAEQAISVNAATATAYLLQAKFIQHATQLGLPAPSALSSEVLLTTAGEINPYAKIYLFE